MATARAGLMSIAAAGDAARSGAAAGRARRARGFAFWLGVLVGAGMALRVAQTLLVAPWPPGFFNDELYYSALGKMLAAGTGFVRPDEWLGHHVVVPTAERPPLYPLALAGLAKLGLTGSDGQRLLGTVTGGATILLLGLLARRLAGDRAGLLAAGLAAAYPVLVAADGALMTESLFGALAAGMLLAALRLADAPSAGRAVALGAVAGVAALARSEALLLLPLVLLPVLRRPRGLRAAAVAVVAFAVVLTPWTVRNWSAFDRPVLIATEGGETLRGANCDTAYHGENLGSWQASCLSFRAVPGVNEAEGLDREGHDGVRYALDHPGRLPVVAVARLARTWGLWPFFQVPEGRRHWVMHVGAVVFFLLLPLAAWGILALRRRGVGAPLWIVVTPVVSVTVTALVSYGTLRFRHSAELVLVVLAAVGLDAVWRRRDARAGQARAGR